MEHFTVTVQDVLEFRNIWMIISIVIAVVALVLIVLAFVLFKRKKTPKVFTPKRSLDEIKQSYLDELVQLNGRIVSGSISIRKAFAKISIITRGFVKEATGIDVRSYTLEEIVSLKIPTLTFLVSNCYEPEFAEISSEQNETVLAKTMSTAQTIISQWRNEA